MSLLGAGSEPKEPKQQECHVRVLLVRSIQEFRTIKKKKDTESASREEVVGDIS